MILYQSDYFGLRTLGYFNGSAAYRALIPALCSTLLLVLYMYTWGEGRAAGTPGSLQNPYVLTISISAFSLLLNFRLNSSYQRYWEAATSVFQMMSKWNDAAICLAGFHCQSKAYDDSRPPSFDAQYEADRESGRTGRDRSRLSNSAQPNNPLIVTPQPSPNPLRRGGRGRRRLRLRVKGVMDDDGDDPSGNDDGVAAGGSHRNGGTEEAHSKRTTTLRRLSFARLGGGGTQKSRQAKGGSSDHIGSGSHGGGGTKAKPNANANVFKNEGGGGDDAGKKRPSHHRRHLSQEVDADLMMASSSMTSKADDAANRNHSNHNRRSRGSQDGGSGTAGQTQQLARPKSIIYQDRMPSVDIPRPGSATIKSFHPNTSWDWQQRHHVSVPRWGLHSSTDGNIGDIAKLATSYNPNRLGTGRPKTSDDFAIGYFPTTMTTPPPSSSPTLKRQLTSPAGTVMFPPVQQQRHQQHQRHQRYRFNDDPIDAGMNNNEPIIADQAIPVLQHTTPEPTLFLQEVAHLFSLMSAVAMASLRADVEGCASPLVAYVPGQPFPSVNPDEMPSAFLLQQQNDQRDDEDEDDGGQVEEGGGGNERVDKGNDIDKSNTDTPKAKQSSKTRAPSSSRNNNMKSPRQWTYLIGLRRTIYFFLGISRSPRQRTIYNASRPFTVLGGISDREVERLQHARGPEAQLALCTMWLKEFIAREYLAGSIGNVAPPILSRVYTFLTDGQLHYNQCRKIAYIQFPFPHAQLTTFLIFVSLFLFPYLFYSYVSNATVACLLNFATVACFEGIQEVSHELQDPFYQFPNDLPLNNYQAQYNESLISSLYAGFHPDFWCTSNNTGSESHPAGTEKPASSTTNGGGCGESI